jgi:hypothetical protein
MFETLPLYVTLTWFALLKKVIYGRIITVNIKKIGIIGFFILGVVFCVKIFFLHPDILKFHFNCPSLLMGGYRC